MKRITASITAALFAVGGFAVVGAASPANADTCRESIWGEDIWGNKRYDCSDGSYTLKKDWFTDTWDDPWATYELESNSYGSNSWSGKCKYKKWRNSYECRGQSSNSYGSGSNFYGSNGFYGSNNFYGSDW